jgi:hypothetical protein
MSLFDITAALEVRLAAMPGVLPTVWENTEANPPTTAFQQVNFLPGAPDNPAVGSGMYRELGLMQVTLLYPINSGSGAAYQMAETIRNWFPRASSYSSGGFTAIIERTAAIGPGSVQSERFVLPVSIYYFSNIVIP